MLPVHLAENIRQQVLYYLQSTFDFRDPDADKAFERFLLDPENGIFKGPWVHLRMPYRPASRVDDKIPLTVIPAFLPFKHQIRSWHRLSTHGREPLPTIVTTGTGSGKTECFLYPVLDHCLRAKRAGQQGIKAIVLYPMNALASDQEKRFAKTISEYPEFKAAGIRVGNYTGRYDPSDPGSSTGSGTRAMGRDHGISHHETLQDSPPDILLTNYKMLDYLLIRPTDQRLWRLNSAPAESGSWQQPLQYLVLDELHTYDGAQGADVACLIRRLKERLGLQRSQLCVVGTSATLDSRDPQRDSDQAPDAAPLDVRESGEERLARFASTLFEEDIRKDAVITEDRLSVAEMVASQLVNVDVPDPESCCPDLAEDAIEFARRQSINWGVFGDKSAPDDPEQWALQVGQWLKRTKFFLHVLKVFEAADKANRPVLWRELVERLALEELGLSALKQLDLQSLVCGSFFALIAHAKEERSGRALPLVPTQVQLWIRELRRIGRLTTNIPVFGWLDEPAPDVAILPTFHCTECGESGWIAMGKSETHTKVSSAGATGFELENDPSKIYRGWFGFKGKRSPSIVVISPDPNLEGNLFEQRDAANNGKQLTMGFEQWYLCSKSLVLRQGDGPCPLTGDSARFPVKISCKTDKDPKGYVFGDQRCPHCDSTEGVFFVGSQAATLSSIAIDELFGSTLNEDAKLLAFTDSVQDASHRAGFFSARTYNFTLRTALQHVIDDAGPAGVPLVDVGARLLDWWSQPRPGWPGHVKDALATFMPSDLAQYADFLSYRNDPAQKSPPERLRKDISQRLSWEVTNEFSLMLSHGRRLETAAASCVAWDEDRISATIAELRARFPKIEPLFETLSDDDLRLWMYGFLHRFRQRGALGHAYLKPLASAGWWGKSPKGTARPEREIYPPAGHFKPRLLVTTSTNGHEHVLGLTKGQSLSPWPLVWCRRALGLKNIDELSYRDLIEALLDVGTANGLLEQLHHEGNKAYYAINAHAARLTTDCVTLKCSATDRLVIRPSTEARYWDGAPSIEYYADSGTYGIVPPNARQSYYQNRYRKGVVRRIVAQEHTGLLQTEERETLERRFKQAEIADDPNILTCTSTLEMGIDIGDLSSTMLCSIPPNTANYLQRIGRAGRSTGTALIVSVVNQRPHDLFFYGRPGEMLRGKVDPPGCWLDASAVLVRQYLAFCFDTATHLGELTTMPRSGKQFVDDMARPSGSLPSMLAWMTKNEEQLQQAFLRRFDPHVQADTAERFLNETKTELIGNRLHQVATEFDRQLRELDNAKQRLRDQVSKLDKEELDAKAEIDQELRILQARSISLASTTMLEILTDHGLLPNYAFPERGVRFLGSIYNKHRADPTEHRPVELSRPARAALKELAPANHFYTHSRRFEVQEIALGQKDQAIVEEWAICGRCGHMRLTTDLTRPDAIPACPQCGHGDGSDSQLDLGQRRRFVEFSRSQARSQMENYESYSSDSSDERERNYYHMLRNFDLTREAPVGAVGEDKLPFGIEYRASLLMREINSGFDGETPTVPFGINQAATTDGFRVCRDCGVIVPPNSRPEDVQHRRHCTARRKHDKLKQEGRTGTPFVWESVYLFRQLQSEAIRLLLPISDDAEIDTLSACLHLGLRQRFGGNPAHLIVAPQILPDITTGTQRYYLVLMDAVPGGTGYLKTLFQETDTLGRPGEGIVSVLKLALRALEACPCRKFVGQADKKDPDGCYRCLRTYHQQYNAKNISREVGIKWLTKLVAAGDARVTQTELASIRPNQLFGSMLEKKFCQCLEDFVSSKSGKWEQTIIRGATGFRFSLPGTARLWELELQPKVGPEHGVAVMSQPDFMLRCDDDRVLPVAIFTDGFEFHCHPHNRLADDFSKRRALIKSRRFRVWSLTWDDLQQPQAEHSMVCPQPLVTRLQKMAVLATSEGQVVPDVTRIVRHAWQQLTAFLEQPLSGGWTQSATFISAWPLQQLAPVRTQDLSDLQASLGQWREGAAWPPPTSSEDRDWTCNEKTSLNQDVIAYAAVAELLMNRTTRTIVVARLGDSDSEVTGSDYLERWRRFLAVLNLYQFVDSFEFWAASEVGQGTAPEIPQSGQVLLDAAWAEVVKATITALRPTVEALAKATLTPVIEVPEVEFVNEQIDDDAFAELAWPKERVVVLAGEQATHESKWQAQGWRVTTDQQLQARGTTHLINLLRNSSYNGSVTEV